MYVDLFGLSGELAAARDNFVEDGLHPSGKQYERWANLIWDEIESNFTGARR
jgi:lysophospholipase L1-like esterase